MVLMDGFVCGRGKYGEETFYSREMKYGAFVYYFVSQKLAVLVFVGTLLLTENYFYEITQLIGSCKQ